MSLEKLETYSQTVQEFSKYYEKFLEDGSCKAVKSRALLEEMASLIIKIERDIYYRLIELGYIEEAADFLQDEEDEVTDREAEVISLETRA